MYLFMENKAIGLFHSKPLMPPKFGALVLLRVLYLIKVVYKSEQAQTGISHM